MTKLTRLNLGFNDLSGTLSTKVGNLQTLLGLFIYDQDTGLNGTIPTEIGLLKNVQNMRLAGNEFTGIIPTELGNLTSLVNLFLKQNFLQGTFPVEVGK